MFIARPSIRTSMPRVALVVAAVLVAAAFATAQPPGAVSPLRSPAAPGSAEPNLARAPDGSVILSWIESRGEDGHALRFSRRPPRGNWSEPREVASGRDWFVNWADFPSLLALKDGSLVAHWLRRSAQQKHAYDILLARSGDGGATWSKPVLPHRDGVPAEHGFVSLLAGDGATGVVWLDGRETGKPGGATALRFTTLGKDGALGDERVLDERVCDCCQTAAVRADDAVVVAYRDRSQGELRDISVVRESGGQWSRPRPVSGDAWKIDGCPVNGPALDAAGPRVALAWFSAAAERPKVRVAFSADAGLTFAPPLDVDADGPLGRVDVALLEGGDALVLWLGRQGETVRVLARRVSPQGRRGAPVVVAETSGARASGFPRMERAGDEIVFAWTEPSDPSQVRTAVMAAPR
jgi:hypothetical protein